MPRDGSGVYTKPYPNVVSGTTIESLVYNGQVDDVTADLNTARPIVSGGTGANNAAGGLFNLGGEKATQVVTSYDSHIWVPGSFRSAVGATGAPNATAIFSGVCYIHEALANPPTNQNVTVEARDVSDGVLYIRTKTAGTWSVWRTERDTIDAAPLDALAYNGMQVNGSMDVSQERGSSPSALANDFACDQWYFFASAGAFSVVQSPTSGFLPGGIANHIAITTTTAPATPTGTQFYSLDQNIEGFRTARLAWGTVNAQPITIGFWTGHHRAGVYSVGIRNSGDTRSYVATYTQAVGDVWQYNVITVPGDTAGTWLGATNGVGLHVGFTLACGPTYTAPAANTWGSAVYVAAPGQLNGVAATSDTFRITGVVVLPGIEAPTAARSPLIMRPFDQELVTCQRYFYKTLPHAAPFYGVVQAVNTTAAYGTLFSLPVPMRAAPATNSSAVSNFSLQPAGGGGSTVTSISVFSDGTRAWVSPVNVASGIVSGNAVLLSGNSSSWLLFDARL